MTSFSNAMQAEANVSSLHNFEPGLFGPIEISAPARKKSEASTGKGSRGTRPVLSWRDHILPELVGRADNGDPSVKAVSSSEQEHQTLHLLSMAQELAAQVDNSRERKLYAQSLKRNPDNAGELAEFLQGSAEAEENFDLWLARKLNRKIRALERKANRLLSCSVIARPMDCIDCGLKGYIRFYCGNRYCRYCGNQIFIRLFAKYIRLKTIVENAMCRDGFRPSVVLATFTFTTKNLGRMPTAEEIRQFNHDVRTTLRLVCEQLGIKASKFGVLWCDEFGGWNKELQDYNTNLHCHGIWLGPFLPFKLVSAVWKKVRESEDYRFVIEPVPFRDGMPDFARALGHALKYTSKHVSTYSPERLAELELAFSGVRRVHTMGMFYNAKETRPEAEPSPTPLCPSCDGRLAYPKNCALQLVKDLEKEGRVDLEQLRRTQGTKKIPEEVPL
ncbi:MAG: hypothetical protein HY010_17645 [Acidobacteria bacterium]|nr:hypothetical protein [Acidobacteriota bacterium]